MFDAIASIPAFVVDSWDLVVAYRYISVPVALISWGALFVLTFKDGK